MKVQRFIAAVSLLAMASVAEAQTLTPGLPVIPMGDCQLTATQLGSAIGLSKCTRASFTASAGASSNLLVVTSVTGVIQVHDTLLTGTGVTAGGTIVNQVSGTPGGAGTYTISNTNTTSSATVTTGGIPQDAQGHQPSMVVLSVEAAPVRYRDDGGAPTSGIGVELVNGTMPFTYVGNIGGLQLIGASGSPVVNVGFYPDQLALMLSIAPTQSNVQAALGAFLSAVLPGSGPPAVFVGTITGTTLTVTEILQGAIALNVPVLGASPGTTISAFDSGTGGIGTYEVSTSQTLGSAPTGVTMATGWTVVAGQQNRVAEPVNPWFVVFTPLRYQRLSTNVDSSSDCKFTGSITGTTLTASDVETGAITQGATIFGLGVSSGTVVQRQISGAPGQDGTYQVSVSQTVGASTLSAGQKVMVQSAEVTIQCDFHAPDTTGADAAQTVSTALRDEYGTSFFSALSPPLNGVSPLYADDPRQVPFVNGENQWETRWSLDACLQVMQSVAAPLEYADAVAITIHEVP